MSKECKECGHQMDDNAQVCPACGCPVEDASAAAYMQQWVLDEGKSTDAEEIVTDVAEKVRWLCKLFGWLSLIEAVVGGIICAATDSDMWWCMLMGIIVGPLLLALWFFLGKVLWGLIMLFVNMSTTLKRIEIKLEENGTH